MQQYMRSFFIYILFIPCRENVVTKQMQKRFLDPVDLFDFSRKSLHIRIIRTDPTALRGFEYLIVQNILTYSKKG